MTTTPAESAPFKDVATEFASFLKHYITWHDQHTAAEAEARAAVKAAGGRIITGGQDGPWVDGRSTETYYDQETGEKLGVIVWQNNDMDTPVSSTMEFRDATCTSTIWSTTKPLARTSPTRSVPVVGR